MYPFVTKNAPIVKDEKNVVYLNDPILFQFLFLYF